MDNDKRKMRHRHINIPYTRTEYIRRLPEGKEKQMKWQYGDPNAKFDHELLLRCLEEKYVSINSLDAIRIAINYHLSKSGKPFFFKIWPYPHQILREHGLLGVAKAERLAKGMKLSFGKSSTRVAHVHQGQTLVSIRVNETDLNEAKIALDIASKKISCKTLVVRTCVS